MREIRRTRLPSVTALTLAALMALPLVATAASGLPATVSMEPPIAGPGTEVEVTGLDFPAGAAVQLQLMTQDGAFGLGSAKTADGGYFRHTLSLPPDAGGGLWELRATASDGSVAAHLFEASDAAALAAADAAVQEATAAVVATTSGNSIADITVMLVAAFLIAGVGGAAAYVWYQVKRADQQPGMALAQDPIWARGDFEPEPLPGLAATEAARARDVAEDPALAHVASKS